MSSAFPNNLPCPDWVFASGSNVHVARDRSWFADDYTPFKTVLEGGLSVEGIGTVELPTKRSPSSSGPKAHTILRLSNVLHVPGAVCNILGLPLADEYQLETNFRDPSKGSIRDPQGRPLAYFRHASPSGLIAIRLSGPPVGPTVGPSLLSTNGNFVRAFWPDAEKERWAAYKSQQSVRVNAGHDLSPAADSPSQQARSGHPLTAKKSTDTAAPSQAANGSNPPPKGLEKLVDKPFTRLSEGIWLHGRPEKDVYRLLIDSYRMRMEDNYVLGYENTSGSIYTGAPDGLKGFRRFLQLAAARPGLLPTWWDGEKTAACERLGMDPDEWCGLRYCVEKGDIVEHYGDQLFPMQLRMFGEAVYRSGPGGVDGKEMLRQMVMHERGDGPRLLKVLSVGT